MYISGLVLIKLLNFSELCRKIDYICCQIVLELGCNVNCVTKKGEKVNFNKNMNSNDCKLGHN